MYESLAGKVALVTGGGAGIGRAIALRLAREGCTVAVNDVRTEVLEELVERFEADQLAVSGWAGNMTDVDDVRQVVEGTVVRHGRLDVLVNNVGLFTFADLATLTPAEWDACMAVNTRSTFLCCRAAIPHLRRTQGTIVNISSGAGKVGGTGAGAYSASKWGVIGLTKSLASELAPAIRVNAVCPGIIVTAMDTNYMRHAAAARGVSEEQFDRERLERIPLGRNGTPEDVANAVAFLCSDQAGYTTGEAFNVSGGMVMH